MRLASPRPELRENASGEHNVRVSCQVAIGALLDSTPGTCDEAVRTWGE